MKSTIRKESEMFKKFKAERARRQEILAKLDALENKGMIDLMYHQWKRFQGVTYFTMYQTQWKRWIRL